MIQRPDSQPEGAFFLLPVADCQIIDNWFVCGLCGTGSKDIVVEDLFVPAHRVLKFADTRAGTVARRAPSRQPDLPHPAVDARRVDAGLDRDRRRQAARSKPISI